MRHRQLLLRRGVAEDLLYAALRIVKVAAHGDHLNIPSFLRHHLETLHGADAAVRIEYHHPNAGCIRKSFECRLPRIAGGRNEDEDRIARAHFLTRRAHELRQELERHILERARRSVPKLEHRETADRTHGRPARIVKRVPIGAPHTFCQLFLRIIREKGAQDANCALLIGERHERFDVRETDLWERCGDKESAVCGEPPENRRGRGNALRRAACAEIIHCIHPFAQALAFICAIIV